MNFDELIKNVERWAYDKKLLPGSPEKQTLKLMEEAGELAGALLRMDMDKILDGIGDCFVVLIILSRQLDILPEICLQTAWEEIKDRKGKTVNDTFIKEPQIYYQPKLNKPPQGGTGEKQNKDIP